MRDIGRRLERLEDALKTLDCVCDGSAEVKILVVESGWNEARIKLVEDAIQGTCPVHGLQSAPILRLAGSDVYG